jgi:hypothetical protein
MSTPQLIPNCDETTTTAPKRVRDFSYVLIVTGTARVDLFKVYVNGGSVHLADFPTVLSAMHFVEGLPQAQRVALL